MTFMIPANVQKQIAELHISRAAQSKAKEIILHAGREISKLSFSIHLDTITFCEKTERKRVESIKSFIHDLKAKMAEQTGSYTKVFRDVWGNDACIVNTCERDYGASYENLIHEANLNGAEIYDSSIAFIYNIANKEPMMKSDAACLVEEMRSIAKNNKFIFKTSDLIDGDKYIVHVYTTTKGVYLIRKELSESNKDWKFNDLDMNFHALSLSSFKMEDVLKDSAESVCFETCALEATSLIRIRTWLYRDESVHHFWVGRLFTKNIDRSSTCESVRYVTIGETPNSNRDYLPIDEVFEHYKLLGIDSKIIEVVKNKS